MYDDQRGVALKGWGGIEKGRFAGKGWSWGIGKAGKEGEPAVWQVAEGWRAKCGRLARSQPGGGEVACTGGGRLCSGASEPAVSPAVRRNVGLRAGVSWSPVSLESRGAFSHEP